MIIINNINNYYCIVDECTNLFLRNVVYLRQRVAGVTEPMSVSNIGQGDQFTLRGGVAVKY